MADIFISYSKADRDKVVMLAAYLESEGWTIWWDTNLAAGDAFRDEIMRELTAARAVIVLWTQTSIKSDFVRAEAGRAKADGKLIPVKESDVAYPDIPLPFGEMHTEPLANRELIRAAIVSQLAKPAVQPTALKVATKTLRYQVLTWMGIIGGSLTLFANLQAFLNLASWAKWVVTHWHELTGAFWRWCFSIFHVSVPQYWTGLLSFVLFGAMIAVSQRLIAARQDRVVVARDAPALPLLRIRTGIAAVWIVLTALALRWINDHPATIWPRPDWLAFETFKVLATFGILILALTPQCLLVAVSKDRLKVTGIVVLTTIFFYIVVVAPIALAPQDRSKSFTFALPIIFSGITAAMLTIAPVNRLLKRLLFLGLGLIVLLALNAISKYVPEIRGWLNPSSS